MRTLRNKTTPSDWRFTIEQIGRELRKIYRHPQRLPRRLRALSHDWNQNRAKAETDEISMTPIDEIRALVFHSRSRIAQDRAALRRMAEELSYTDQVIERATLAYNVSLWTLEKFERSQFNLRLSAPNPPRPGA
jgi:hypothetical protein